ncbi:uncharacterized protein PAC_02713 [Phialocephala subalpina]|uniref:Uncharacterized protein n=1 Tax=Phialocephala subalpina TaxID=576137 RepID=A0A1L7WJA6_9HELO|nr:uncharacterized protein PAC_02713 [Phialocephala subalpina]
MQAPTSPASQNAPQPAQFSAELPDNRNSVATTQFGRHELPSQKSQNNLQQAAYNPPTWPPFSIPTENDSLSSGFPYTSKLRDLRVAPDQWLQFTTEIINAAKLTFQEDAAAWTAGAKRFRFVVMPYDARNPVIGTNHNPASPIQSQASWNGSSTTTTQSPVSPEMGNGTEIEKATKKQAKRFRFVVMPYDARNPVIGTNHNPASPIQSQASWNGSSTTTTQSPVSPEMGNGTVYIGDGKWNPQSMNTSPVEVSTVRPVGELPAGHRKSHNPFCSNTYELDGSSPQVAKKEG